MASACSGWGAGGSQQAVGDHDRPRFGSQRDPGCPVGDMTLGIEEGLPVLTLILWSSVLVNGYQMLEREGDEIVCVLVPRRFDN